MSLFSDNIKFLRKYYRCKQEELADILAISRPTLGDYERGRTEPNITVITAIAKYFKISIDALVTIELSESVLSQLSAANSSTLINNGQIASGNTVKQKQIVDTPEKDISHKVALLEQEIATLKDKLLDKDAHVSSLREIIADKDAHISSLREIIALYKK